MILTARATRACVKGSQADLSAGGEPGRITGAHKADKADGAHRAGGADGAHRAHRAHGADGAHKADGADGADRADGAHRAHNDEGPGSYGPGPSLRSGRLLPAVPPQRSGFSSTVTVLIVPLKLKLAG